MPPQEDNAYSDHNYRWSKIARNQIETREALFQPIFGCQQVKLGDKYGQNMEGKKETKVEMIIFSLIRP